MRFTQMMTGTAAVALAALAPVSAQTFTSAKGYSITPASAWKTNSSGMMGTDVFFYTMPVHGFAPNLNVVVTPTTPGDTLATGMQQIKSMYPHIFTHYHSVQLTRGSIGGYPAILSAGTYISGDNHLRMRQVAVIRGPKSYVFTCTAPDAVFAKYNGDFTQMLASVHLK
ncbi:hypothetical protein CCAX7_48870 [Capsulimonas corticalis]|uniref:Uncharacterized protein n=1 Tax=Capsulimonas corticalis TaxID=2219043 RepID=A0A402CQ90_9BACT|nr:DcrB-related protein [Capsulimonas corticalis]BDI32836.1 hypothetical protein CCAX7_48870 [Capsulimonas corticalis]